MTICAWTSSSELEQYYHDTEWGIPVYDDAVLFEFLVLEGAQAGLSWRTVLQKRAGYRQAFDQFNVQKIANYDVHKKLSLSQNPQIIRHQLKINSVVSNARLFIQIQKKYGSFSAYIWSFVKGKPIQNAWKRRENIPTHTELSDLISVSLKRQGFKFVGTTICYAYMQAVGMVNDHLLNCPRYRLCQVSSQ